MTEASDSLDTLMAIARIENLLGRMPFGGTAYHGIGGHLSDIRRMSQLDRLKLIETKLTKLLDELLRVGGRLTLAEETIHTHATRMRVLREFFAELAPPVAAAAPSFDEVEAAGLDGTLRDR